MYHGVTALPERVGSLVVYHLIDAPLSQALERCRRKRIKCRRHQPTDADPGKAPGPRYTGYRTGEGRKAPWLWKRHQPRPVELLRTRPSGISEMASKMLNLYGLW